MRKIKLIYILVLPGILFAFAGCAGSESTSGGTTSTETQSDNREARSAQQAAMHPDTNMEPDDTTDTNISANNPIGRNMNIVATVQQNPDLSIFLELIKAADMVVVLESPAQYTVFAPTNEAFNALPAGTTETLKQPDNKMELTRLLQSHVLPNKVTSSEMQHNIPLKTAQGEEIIVSKNGQKITVGGANIITSDVGASNGIIHVIDKVLVPPKE